MGIKNNVEVTIPAKNKNKNTDRLFFVMAFVIVCHVVKGFRFCFVFNPLETIISV